MREIKVNASAKIADFDNQQANNKLASVHPALPLQLADAANELPTSSQKDTFLACFLPLMGALAPHVTFRYGNSDIGLNFNTLIVDPDGNLPLVQHYMNSINKELEMDQRVLLSETDLQYDRFRDLVGKQNGRYQIVADVKNWRTSYVNSPGLVNLVGCAPFNDPFYSEPHPEYEYLPIKGSSVLMAKENDLGAITPLLDCSLVHLAADDWGENHPLGVRLSDSEAHSLMERVLRGVGKDLVASQKLGMVKMDIPEECDALLDYATRQWKAQWKNERLVENAAIHALKIASILSFYEEYWRDEISFEVLHYYLEAGIKIASVSGNASLSLLKGKSGLRLL